jgi:hypothetical protein
MCLEVAYVSPEQESFIELDLEKVDIVVTDKAVREVCRLFPTRPCPINPEQFIISQMRRAVYVKPREDHAALYSELHWSFVAKFVLSDSVNPHRSLLIITCWHTETRTFQNRQKARRGRNFRRLHLRRWEPEEVWCKEVA